MVHRTAVKVRFYELDPYNHVNHSAYIQYFEVGRIELLESIGFGLAALDSLGFHIVVTALRTRFLRSAGPGEELIVETGVGKIGRATSRWEQRLLRGEEVLATQTVEAAITDRSGRPTRLPVDFAAALGPYVIN